MSEFLESDGSTRAWYYPWGSARKHFVRTLPWCLLVLFTQIYMWYADITFYSSWASYIPAALVSIWAMYCVIMMLMNRNPFRPIFRLTRSLKHSK